VSAVSACVQTAWRFCSSLSAVCNGSCRSPA
jgi:hypothetical protein